MKLSTVWDTLRKSIDPAETDLIDQPVPPETLPAGKLRLHLFGADFDSDAAAYAFCYESAVPDGPTALNRELEGAFVDTDHVEVVHGRIVDRLLDFLEEGDADDIHLRLAGDNTLIIVTEDAFGGLPYALDDTDRLTYLGSQIVNV